MGLKDALRKVANLVVEVPPDDSLPSQFSPAPTVATAKLAQKRTVAETVQATPGPDLSQVAVPQQTVQNPPVRADGTPDFEAIYSQAGLSSTGFGAEEALQVIGSLPAELPLDVKRKTVGATLSAMGKAMGVTVDGVVADSSRKIAALHSFTEQLSAQTGEYEVAVQNQVSQLKAKIQEHEDNLAQAKKKLAGVVAACDAEGARLDDVVEFFTLDEGASKHA